MQDERTEQTVGELSAQDLTGRTRTEDGQLLFVLGDGESRVEISDEIGDPEVAACAAEAVAAELRAYAARIRYRTRLRTAGWT
jgi:hypothetical protein